MDANIEELEKRMGIKIEAVRDMMLDRFSGVDKKLIAIEQLLKKIIEPQSETGNPPENRWNLMDKNIGEGGTESSENQDKGKKLAVRGGDGGPSHESGSNRALQAQILSDGVQGLPGGRQLGDRVRQGPSHESVPKKPLQAQISSAGDDQETNYQIGGPHESGPKKPLQAQISSDGDDQETDYQILGQTGGLSHESGPEKPLQAHISPDGDEQDYQIQGPPGGIHLGDGGKQGPSLESGPQKPLQAQMSSVGDEHETDDQIRGPPGGLYLGDRGRQGSPWEAGSSGGWVGLYTNHYGTYNPPGPHYSFGTDFCGPAWVGPKETDFSKKNGPRFEGQRVNTFVEECPETQRERVPEGYGSKVVNADVTGRVRKKIQYDIVKGLNYSGGKGVKTGHDGSFKESDNKPQAQVVAKGSNEGRPKTRRSKRKAKKVDVNGTKNSCTGSSGKKVVKTDQDDKVTDNTVAGEEDIKDDETDVSLQDSSKTDQWAKNDKSLETNFIWRSSDKSLDWSKLVEAKVASQHGSGALWGKKGDNKPQAKAVTDGSNEKGNDENQKAGSWGLKEEGCGSKRKHPDSLVGGPNDGPISSGLLSTSKRCVDDEQEIHFNEIEPIMQSTRRIMNQYNDGDPLSADDQAYILENVFNHHPQKAQKIGAGVDYIMVSKHMKFQESRCFYVVTTDGRKEDFSYHKCLKNFASGKYPNKVDELKSS